MQYPSSNNPIEPTEAQLNFPEMMRRNKSNTNLHNAQMDDSTKGNSRDFTNSSQEGMNESNSNQKVEGVQFSSSNSGNYPTDPQINDQEEYQAKGNQFGTTDELERSQEDKQSIDTVFESNRHLKSEYLDLKVRFFNKQINHLEELVEKFTREEFSLMLQNFSTKLVHVFPVIELLKEAYTEKLRMIVNELRQKTKSIEYITMKEVQSYFTNLEENLRQKVKNFVSKQTELLKFANITSDESDSSPEPQKMAQEQPIGTLRKPIMQFKQDMDSNFGSINSSERRTARSKNVKSSDVKGHFNKLPGSASKILNQWLSDHMDDPYPTQEEKVLLASKTRLSMRQITNWFVNHRGRRLKSLKNKASFSHQIKSKLLASTMQPSAN